MNLGENSVPERKVKVNMPGLGIVDGTEVPITESTERWTDIKLEDGTVLRLKPIIMAVTRLDGRFDPQGNPMYAVQASQAMVATSPDHLREHPTEPAPKVH